MHGIYKMSKKAINLIFGNNACGPCCLKATLAVDLVAKTQRKFRGTPFGLGGLKWTFLYSGPPNYPEKKFGSQKNTWNL